MPHDAVQVGIGRLQDLLDPVDQLDVRISPQLAKDRRALDRLVRQAIEFAEENRAAELTHAASSPRPSLTTLLHPGTDRQHRNPSDGGPATSSTRVVDRVQASTVEPRDDPASSER